ncbi:ABC transporter permease subunit [Alsobacter sp. R-9]
MRGPGLVAAAAVVGIVGTGLAGLWSAGDGLDLRVLGSPWLHRILLFSTLQAGLSTLISLVAGAALALALARRRAFPGRGQLVGLLGTATALPAVVVVFAVVTVYGRSGWLGTALGALGLPAGQWLYGLPGILIAHVFLNAPFCARVFLRALEAQPPETWRLASHLGLPPRTLFRHIDAPLLARETPALAVLVFLLCFTSFATVLALGGGPDRATLEVAIYEALRLDADFARAALLSGLQLAIGLLLTVLFVLSDRGTRETAGAGRGVARPDAASGALRLADAAVLVAGTLFLAPLALSVATGAGAIRSLADAEVLRATAASIAIAATAAVLAVTAAVALALAGRDLRSARHGTTAAAFGHVAVIPLAVPPFTLVAGLFVVLRGHVDVATMGVPMVVVVNALMALPFAMRLVEPPLALAERRYGRLAAGLGIRGLARLRIVDRPFLLRPLRGALATAAALSMGDLGVVAFFGGPDLVTLPLLLYQRLGAYRMDEAAAVALLLAALVFVLAWAAGAEADDARA